MFPFAIEAIPKRPFCELEGHILFGRIRDMTFSEYMNVL